MRTSILSVVVLTFFTGIADAQTVTVTQSRSGRGCAIPAMPSYASLPARSLLADPFTFLNGTRVKTRADWNCRRAEIVALAQEFEYGYKPNTAYSATTATRNANTLAVTVTDNGRTISFN